MSDKYDNKGKAALWKRVREGGNDPVYTGNIVAHRDIKEGEILHIAFWPSKSDNKAAPGLTGKVSDPRNVGAPAGDADDDDDIPF